MKCVDCAYYWKEEGESYPHCQFGERTWLDIPPCEQEDIDREREQIRAEQADNEWW